MDECVWKNSLQFWLVFLDHRVLIRRISHLPYKSWEENL